MAVIAFLLHLTVDFLPVVGRAVEALLDRADVVFYKRKLSWRNIERGVLRLAREVHKKGFNVDLVIGSGRSGSIVGAWLAGELGKLPYATIDIRNVRTDGERLTEIRDHGDLQVEGKRLLLVSSEHRLGRTSKRELDYFREKGAADVKTAALVQYTFSGHTADCYAYCLEREVDFPWRLTNAFAKVP
jgi:hypoxanthine phosphoribosyltransferase